MPIHCFGLADILSGWVGHSVHERSDAAPVQAAAARLMAAKIEHLRAKAKKSPLNERARQSP